MFEDLGDQLLRPLAERIYLFSLCSSPAGKTPCSGGYRTAEYVFDYVSAIRVLSVGCRMGYGGYSVVDVAAAVGFTTTSRCALVV